MFEEMIKKQIIRKIYDQENMLLLNDPEFKFKSSGNGMFIDWSVFGKFIDDKLHTKNFVVYGFMTETSNRIYMIKEVEGGTKHAVSKIISI